MNATEVETLLLRVDATYPAAQLSEAERRLRAEEWLDSVVAVFDWHDVGRPAWRRWKDTRDRPPTPHLFAEVCRAVRGEQQELGRAASEPVTDEQRAQNVAFVRAARDALHAMPEADDG